jgi:hypothetical protein
VNVKQLFELDFETEDFSDITVGALDRFLAESHGVIDHLTMRIVTLERTPEDDWERFRETVQLPNLPQYIRIQRAELEREYARYDQYQKLLALKLLDVL